MTAPNPNSQLAIFYAEGQAARARDVPRSACPYRKASARNAWLRGWASPASSGASEGQKISKKTSAMR